jgi:hypothetical protein
LFGNGNGHGGNPPEADKPQIHADWHRLAAFGGQQQRPNGHGKLP